MTFRNPEPFYHGLIMLLHMRHHLLAEGMGLRHLCDWAVFVDHFSDDEFRAMFEKKLKKTGLWRFAVTVSLSAHLAIGLPYREFMGMTVIWRGSFCWTSLQAETSAERHRAASVKA